MLYSYNPYLEKTIKSLARLKNTDSYLFLSLEISINGLYHSKLQDALLDSRDTLKSDMEECKPESFISGFKLHSYKYAGLTAIEAICRYRNGTESGYKMLCFFPTI